MSGYLFAFSLIILGLGLGLRGAASSLSKLGSLRSEIATREQQVVDAGATQATREQWLQAEAQVPDLAAFHREWRPEIERSRDLAGITQRVNAEAEALQLPVQEQRTEENRALNGTGPAVSAVGTVSTIRYSVAVTGDLATTLRWLGRIEEVLPLARVERVDLTPSQDWVVLRCTLAIPQLKLDSATP